MTSPTTQPWLIATDLDGTLFDHTLHIHPRVRETLAAAQAAGHIVTLATGRMLVATVPIAAELGVDQPLICYQGALVQQGDKIWYHQPVPMPLAREVITYAQAHNLHLNIYMNDRLYYEKYTPFLDIYMGLNRWAETIEAGDLLVAMTQEPTKAVFILEEAAAADFHLLATATWGGRGGVVRSHPNFVEVTHADVSKGNAVMALAEQLQIPRERVLAIGDNDNDRSMIAAAGVGVAMGNAPDAVKEIADWVAPSVWEEGLAVAIERFVLGGVSE